MSGIFDGMLLVSDYDGTLVPKTKIVTEGVKAAIRHFIENGGRFTVCTGRSYLGFHSYSPEIINAPVILANGALAYDYEKECIAFSNCIGPEAIEPLRGVAREFPQLCIEIYPFNRACTIHLSEKSEQHLTRQSIPFDVISDPADAPQPWNKVMLAGAAEDIAKVQTYLAENWPQVDFLPTVGTFLEVLRKGVNKGHGLLALADALGIRHENVYAVGDGYNDVEMLRAAATAFVPANGDEFAMACADVVVRSNEEDAVAHVIEILESRALNLRE